MKIIKKRKQFSALIAYLPIGLLVLGLVLLSCEDVNNPGSGNPCRVIYHAGEGAGVPPFPQTVAAGNIIELPGQETMTHPSGKKLFGWMSNNDKVIYNPYDRYVVKNNVDFTAQWMTSSAINTPIYLAAPTNVKIQATSSSTISVSWNSVSSATNYEVLYITGNSNLTSLITVTDTSYIHTGLNPNTTYTYYIRAKNNFGYSDLSFPASAATTGVTSIPSQPGSTVPGTDIDDKLAWLKNNAKSGQSYIIEVETQGPNSGISIITHLYYSDRNNITITLRGTGAPTNIYSSRGESPMFRIGSGVTLVLDNNITLQGSYGGPSTAGMVPNFVLVYIESGGKLVMNTGSVITGNHSNSRTGGGVYIDSSGTFEMRGGTISDNSAIDASGGGVNVQGGTFIMNGGIIIGNTASIGGGSVNVKGGTFIMNSGTISGSYAYEGGGVYVSSGTFEMNNGTISGNTAGYGGGGVCVDSANSTFTMHNGSISGNKAYLFGGGVYVNGANFTKTGGIINGYASDESSGNVVKDNTNTIQNINGHGVFAILGFGGRRKETTAGSMNNLSFNGKTGASSGDWDY